MEYDFEVYQKLILDFALKEHLITPEIFVLKYNISNELYYKMYHLVYQLLAKNESCEKVYLLLEEIFEKDFWNIQKYEELLTAFKTEMKLHDICEGELYRTLCDWIEDINEQK